MGSDPAFEDLWLDAAHATVVLRLFQQIHLNPTFFNAHTVN